MLIALADVVAAGGGADHARRRVDAGRWRRVDRGVYLVAGAPFDWTTRQLAAVLASGPGATASHLAAARIWNVPGFGTVAPEVSIPRGRRVRRGSLRVHQSSDLDRCEVVTRDGIPVTSMERTMLDIARSVGHRRLLRSIEAGRRAGHLTWASLIAMLSAHARRGRPGVRKLRATILANADRDEITDTDMELLVLGLLAEAGLPTPVVKHRVLDGDRFVAEVDLAYPGLKIALECDGSVHLDPEVREKDLKRQNDLVLLGWTLLRFSFERVRARPDAVVAEVREAVAAATRRRV